MAQKHYDQEKHKAPAAAEYNDGRLKVHASQLGGCGRAIVAGALDYAPSRPPKYQAALFQAGHDAEVSIKEYLRQNLLTIEDEQRQIELKLNDSTIIGAIDGIATGSINGHELHEPHVLEIKSMSAASHRQWKRHRLVKHQQYAMQISAYMHALDMPAVIIAVDRDGVNDPSKYDLTLLSTPPVTLDALNKHCSALLDCVLGNQKNHGAETWPPCPDTRPRWCQYEYLHDNARTADSLDNILEGADSLEHQAFDAFSASDEQEIETRRTLREAKRHARQADKRQTIIDLQRRSLASLIDSLPEPGTSIHVVSNATADFWQFCPHLLSLMGPAHLHASTWSMNRDNALEMLDLLDQQQLLSATILTGSYFKTREGAVYATLAEGLLSRGQRLLAFWNHSKIMVLYNKKTSIVIEGSANFTMNPRVEQYVITHDHDLRKFHVNWMEEMLRAETRTTKAK